MNLNCKCFFYSQVVPRVQIVLMEVKIKIVSRIHVYVQMDLCLRILLFVCLKVCCVVDNLFCLFQTYSQVDLEFRIRGGHSFSCNSAKLCLTLQCTALGVGPLFLCPLPYCPCIESRNVSGDPIYLT